MGELLYLLLSYKDINDLTIPLKMSFGLILVTIIRTAFFYGSKLGSELLVFSILMTIICVIPFFHLKLLGGADMIVEFALIFDYMQPLPGLGYIFMLANTWFLIYVHKTKKKLPYIPFIYLVSVAARVVKVWV